MTNKEILSRISIEFDNGNICFNTEEGLIAVPVHEVLKQNYNDILLCYSCISYFHVDAFTFKYRTIIF